jgi:phospholipase/carboxylesterase
MDTLPTVEIDPLQPATASVIWLHGLGADGRDFEPIVPQLQLPSSLPVRFVFPHAPHRPITVNQGYVMRAWYDIVAMDVTRGEDAPGIAASQSALEALIARERARGLAASRMVLAGFSQGGAIALHTALRHTDRLAGVLVLSGYLPLAQSLAAEAAPANADVPIFMAHGSADNVIPLWLAKRSREALLAAGYQTEWHTYSMGHGVCLDEVLDIGSWLRRVLGD